MSVPLSVTCSPWATTADLCEPCSELTTLSPDLIGTMLQAASDVLFHLSGRQYPGTCEETVRPIPRALAVDHGRPIRPPWPYGQAYGYWAPADLGGWVAGWGSYRCNRTERAMCTAVPEVRLGGFPVTSIEEIWWDGQLLDPATYTIHDNGWLVRLADPVTTNNGGWPCCQRVDLPRTSKGTWEVTYTYGMPPPPLGRQACTELACQLALACNPKTLSACRLAPRVTNLTRQGLTAVVADPLVFLKEGKTGLVLCDYFLESVNPMGLVRRATVMSPDLGRRVRRQTA